MSRDSRLDDRPRDYRIYRVQLNCTARHDSVSQSGIENILLSVERLHGYPPKAVFGQCERYVRIGSLADIQACLHHARYAFLCGGILAPYAAAKGAVN